MALIASPLGLLIGLALGALGGGGSILAVPALVYVVGQTPQTATTTSLVVVALAALGGLAGHARATHVRWSSGAAFGAAGIGGSIAGSRLNAALPAEMLLAAFCLLMLVAAAAMLRRATAGDTTTGRVAADDHTTIRVAAGDTAAGRVPPAAAGAVGTAARTNRRISAGLVARVVAAGTAVGFLTGLLGVGGGFIIVPALVLVLHFDMQTAVGTSLLVIAINAAMALASHLTGPGRIDWAVAVPFTVAALIGVTIGTRIAARVPAAQLTKAFAVLMIMVAVYTGADVIGVVG